MLSSNNTKLPQIFNLLKTAISMKHNEAKYNKTRYACTSGNCSQTLNNKQCRTMVLEREETPERSSMNAQLPLPGACSFHRSER